MSNEQSPNTLKEDAEYLQLKFSLLKEKADTLPEATRRDLEPKLGRIETMIHALERDAREASGDTGASSETARELRSVVDQELGRLEDEAETLSIGAPTTVTATLDALLHVVESAESRLKRLTSRVKLK